MIECVDGSKNPLSMEWTPEDEHENDFICVESRKSTKSKERKSVVINRPMTRSQKKLTSLPSLLVEMSRGREGKKLNERGLLEWRGVGKKGMSSYLTELIHEHALDFIGFQETMKREYSSKFFRRLDPGGIFFWKWIPSIGKAGGILCGVRHETLGVVSFKFGKYILRFDLWDNLKKCKWSLLVVYGSAHEEFKKEFLVELSSF
jgi:hypothetical protein